MDSEAIDTLLEYLKKMAATLTENDVQELRNIKVELDGYVEQVTSQMPEQSLHVANREFHKCQLCARDWIKIFNDPGFNAGDKTDILREEAQEFFFTVDEKIIAVQKKFFLRGMVDELLEKGEPFSKRAKDARIANARIRILAREQGLTATAKCSPEHRETAIMGERQWYFGDERNFLQSSDAGLNDKEALDYLLQ